MNSLSREKGSDISRWIIALSPAENLNDEIMFGMVRLQHLQDALIP